MKDHPKHTLNSSKALSKIGIFIKKHLGSLFMSAVLVTLLVSPDAKSWVLRQVMLTGIFNASMEEQHTAVVKAAPASFDFQDENGVLRTTSSLRGKVVFINFWASWCGPCRAEFPSIEKLYQKFKDDPDVYFLMINVDNDLSKAEGYLEQYHFSIPLMRASGAVPDVIYTGSLPTTVVLDKSGMVRLKHERFANYASETFIEQMEALLEE